MVGSRRKTKGGKERGLTHPVQICTYFTEETAEQLDRLCELTRRTLAVYMREAVEDLLEKYQDELKAAKTRK
jgi:predicted DNA-binding protein